LKCTTKQDTIDELRSKLTQEGSFRDQMKKKIENLETILEREKAKEGLT